MGLKSRAAMLDSNLPLVEPGHTADDVLVWLLILCTQVLWIFIHVWRWVQKNFLKDEVHQVSYILCEILQRFCLDLKNKQICALWLCLWISSFIQVNSILATSKS